MNKCLLNLWWGTPASAAAYDASTLTLEQRAQAAGRRGQRAELDWRVSRALMQHAERPLAPDDATDVASGRRSSLSHRAGHALFIHGGVLEALGVDLETMRPRDVIGVAAWICTEAEQEALARAPEFARSRIFYTLWTLKEAFLKAAGGDFPADMRRAGLHFPTAYGSDMDGDWLRGCRLRPPDGEAWRAITFGLDTDWVASVVWRPALDADPRGTLLWQAGPHARLPDTQVWGDWRV
jgi:4'-phosphopantetheinyl transferase